MALQVYLESIGCKLNQCERDMLAGQFSAAGYDIVLDPREADLCVVNTCAVTRVAGRKSQRRFRALRRANPSVRLVATGCYAGFPQAPDLREDGLDVDLVVTNAQKRDLVSLVRAELSAWGLDEGATELSEAALARNQDDWVSARALRPRTRPLVKIQDGCDNACAYCIVRTLRGRLRSRPRQQILQEIAGLVRQGYHEVVLTGVHVGAYGRDIEDSLAGLVRAILEHPALERLRLSSIEPWDLARAQYARAGHKGQGHTSGFLALWEDPRLCRHLHLPLQSGCDATLRRMNRHYTTAQYAEWVAQARAAIPGLALTTDVIAGFPGETGSEFSTSVTFIEQMQFARVHAFSYSPRPGTPAAEMPDQVDLWMRQQRARQIREIGRRSGESFRRGFLGCTLPVLWEMGHGAGRQTQPATSLRRERSVESNIRWSGLTDNYIRVYAETERDLSNVLCPARLHALEADGVRGEVLEPV